MRLYKRGRYWWVAWPGDERESSKQTTRPAAESWARQRELERADPVHAAARAATLGRLIVRYLDDRKGAGRSEATLGFYRQKLGHWTRLLGAECPLAEITASAIDGALAQRRAEGASPATVAKEAKALGAALRKAKRWGLWRGDLDELLPDLGETYHPRSRWLPPDELELLVEELEQTQPHYAGAVAFAVASGARRSEIARATRSDLEEALATGLLPIRGTKTAKASRPVAVLSIFRPWLELALRLAREEGAAFGSWVLSGNARREILSACARAGIAPATWNDLRRTHGRWLRRAGVEVELIGEQLRHTSPAMARRVYAQITPEEVGQQIEARLCPPAVRAEPTSTGSNGA